jgi:putative membrane protein
MEKILSSHDRDQLNRHIAGVEKRTDTQIILAVIRRSDSYAEVPWKAFALGASIAGLLAFALNLPLVYWVSRTTVLVAVLATIAGGMIPALLSLFVPGFARFFLSAHRAEQEVLQYAESLFLSKELFATDKRTGILLLVSLFERKVFLLPDKGIGNRLTGDDIQHIMGSMAMPLKQNKVGQALEEGLSGLSKILEAKGPVKMQDSKDNQLPNEIIEEKGV